MLVVESCRGDEDRVSLMQRSRFEVRRGRSRPRTRSRATAWRAAGRCLSRRESRGGARGGGRARPCCAASSARLDVARRRRRSPRSASSALAAVARRRRAGRCGRCAGARPTRRSRASSRSASRRSTIAWSARSTSSSAEHAERGRRLAGVDDGRRGAAPRPTSTPRRSSRVDAAAPRACRRRQRCSCLPRSLFAGAHGAAVVRRAVAGALPVARRARRDARQRARAGRAAADDRGAAGRQPRAGRRAAAARRRASDADDELARHRRWPTDGAGALHAGARVARRLVPLSGRRRRGSTSPVFDGRRRAAAARDAHRRRIHVSDGARPARRAVEEDGGDIYAPAGTDVRVTRPHRSARRRGPHDAWRTARASRSTRDADGTLDRRAARSTANGSYRVALADRDGLKSPGDTEYFIRMLDDRPPEVHVVQPARDGASRRSRKSTSRPRPRTTSASSGSSSSTRCAAAPRRSCRSTFRDAQTSVDRRHTLYLEDLDVQPGDFVRYYVRARDLARGKRSSEARSDIFFLEVKPFEQEFALAQSQAAMGGGSSNPQLDDLVAAQKEIIVATWKLDRRGAGGQRREVRAGHPVGRPRGGRAEDARRGDVELVPRVDDARSAPAAQAGRGAAPRWRAARGPDDCPKKMR